MRSPGAMMTVVINPERNPAAASWVGFSASSGEDCWIFFPIPNPMKLMAKMGATPTRGAPMPEKKQYFIKPHYSVMIALFHRYYYTSFAKPPLSNSAI